jgi:hypothetical protein
MTATRSVPISEYIGQEWQFDPEMNDDTRAVAEAIYAGARPGSWLDLGCGPLLTAWPLFARDVSFLHGLDRNPEVREFHKTLDASSKTAAPADILKAYRAADAFRRDRGLPPIAAPALRVSEVRIQDLLLPVRSWFGRFDTVVQIGCFGCLDSIQSLNRAISLAHAYNAQDGVFISVTWLPSESYHESEVWGGNALRLIGPDEIASAVSGAGYKIRSAEIVQEVNQNYRARVIVVGEHR